jgi:dTDP-4-dehydrorhamnose 3,5-epimerase
MTNQDKSKIEDLILLYPKSYNDFRGEYFQTFNINEYNFTDINGNLIQFKEDDISVSKKNVLRGLHGDKKTWKLVQCLYGEIFFAVVDFRKGSSTYKKHETFILTSKNRMQILIPPGCVNGTLCLSEECIFAYKQSEIYSGSENQFSIRWNDPKIDINWPITNPILSKRDMDAILL